MKRIAANYSLIVLGLTLAEIASEGGWYHAWWFPVVPFVAGCIHRIVIKR